MLFRPPATSSKAMAAGLYTIYHPLLDLRAHPRTRTTLTVQSLNSAQPPSQPLYASSRAAAINASTLSILNAGSIGMRGVPMAVAIAVVSSHGKGKQRAYDDVEEDEQMEQVANVDDDVTLVLDPTRNEEHNSIARFCFGWAFGQEFSSGAPREKGDRGGTEEEQDEEAECVFVESDGEFDGATVSITTQRICLFAFILIPDSWLQFQKAYSASRFACRTLMRKLRAQMTEHFEHSLAGNNA